MLGQGLPLPALSTRQTRAVLLYTQHVCSPDPVSEFAKYSWSCHIDHTSSSKPNANANGSPINTSSDTPRDCVEAFAFRRLGCFRMRSVTPESGATQTDTSSPKKRWVPAYIAGCLAGGPDFELLMMPFICRDLEGERGENEHRRSTNPTKRR